jgi:hypothetical protein
MGKKTLIPEEKWEGLRHAMEEAAGTRNTSKIPGVPPEGKAAREFGKKRGAEEEPGKGRKNRKQDKKKRKKKDRKKNGKGKNEKGGKKKNGKKKKKRKG